MKCYNCGRKADESKENYCGKCGEELKVIDIKEIEVNEGETPTGGTVNFEEQINKGKSFINNNKKAVSIGAAIVGAVIVILLAINIFSGNGVKESQIKEDLIGESMYIGSDEIKITEDILKDVKVISNESEKKEYDNFKLELGLLVNDIEITIEYDVEYIYTDKKWEYVYGEFIAVKDAKLSETKEEAITNQLKKDGLYGLNGYTHIEGAYVQEVSNVVITDENGESEFTADIKMSNGVVTQNAKISGRIIINIKEGKWDIYSMEMQSAEDEIVLSEVDEKVLSEAVKGMIGSGTRGRAYIYSRELGDKKSSIYVGVKSEEITDVKLLDNKYSKEENEYRVEFEAKFSSAMITDGKVKGSLTFNPTLSGRSSVDIKADITEGSINYPKVEDTRKSLLDKKLGDSKLNIAAADTFTETGKVEGELNGYIVNGTIELNGETVNVQVQYSTSAYNAKEWVFLRIVTSNDPMYITAE